MRKNKIVFLIFFIVEFCFGQIPLPTRVIPDKVEILLTSKIYKTSRQPLLIFRYFGAGAADHWVSDLFIEQICFKDSLVFNILGCDIADYSEYYKENQIIINPSAQRAEKHVLIPTDILENNKDKKIIINLNNKKNMLSLRRNDIVVEMNPIKLANISIVKHPIFDFSELILFPKDVYILGISGEVKNNINYVPSIIKFGQKLGFIVANKKYPQVPISFRDRLVYFVIHDPIVNKLQKGRSLKSGNMPDYPQIEVNLSRVPSWGDHL